MCAEDKNACRILFNSAYYLAKQERPFSDCPDLLKLQEKIRRLEQRNATETIGSQQDLQTLLQKLQRTVLQKI